MTCLVTVSQLVQLWRPQRQSDATTSMYAGDIASVVEPPHLMAVSTSATIHKVVFDCSIIQGRLGCFRFYVYPPLGRGTQWRSPDMIIACLLRRLQGSNDRHQHRVLLPVGGSPGQSARLARVEGDAAFCPPSSFMHTLGMTSILPTSHILHE